MTKLSVNLNKFALIRNSRDTDNPNVCGMALRAIQAGVHGITVHPRPDQRHTRNSDVEDLSGLTGSHPDVEFNVEGNPGADFLEIVGRTRPDQCTLVPDAPDQLTSDHGWNLDQEAEKAKPVVKQLQDLGIRVSLFMDPDPESIEGAREVGADRIELYTEPYAEAYKDGTVGPAFKSYADAAQKARDLDLGINAGHDLNLDNLGEFITIPGILEVSIGHALISDALFMGLENAVKAYLEILTKS